LKNAKMNRLRDSIFFPQSDDTFQRSSGVTPRHRKADSSLVTQSGSPMTRMVGRGKIAKQESRLTVHLPRKRNLEADQAEFSFRFRGPTCSTAWFSEMIWSEQPSGVARTAATAAVTSATYASG
jgi:hypothetical protein